jgi:ABC-type transport system, involved in lipoprotein release, permease component
MKSWEDITFRYLKAQKKRTILTIVGVMLSVALITAIGTMVASMRDMLIREAIAQNGDYHASFTGVQPDKINKIQNNVDVKSSGVMGMGGYGIISKVDDSGEKTGKEAPVPPYRYLTLDYYNKGMFNIFNVTLKEGRLPQGPGEIVLDYWALNYFPGKLRVGDKIKLDVGFREVPGRPKALRPEGWSSDEKFTKTGEKEFTIVGLIKPLGFSSDEYIAKGIAYLDSSNLPKDLTYNVYVKMGSVNNAREKAEGIAKSAGLFSADGSTTKYAITYNERVLRLYAQSADAFLNESLTGILIFIILLVVVSTVAVIYNAFNISVLERVSQFGILRCTGATPQQIRKIVLKEARTVSLIGIPLGILSGLLAMKIVLGVIGSFKYVYYKDLTVSISPAVLLLSAAVGFITVYLSAYGPALKAGGVSPLDAVRNAGAFKKENLSKVKNTAIAGLVFGIEGRIAFKNLRRNRKRFRITVFSMVISIVLYIAFGALVDYMFKMDVASNNVDMDFSLRYSNMQDGGIPSSVYNDIQNISGVKRVYKYSNDYVEVLLPENKVNSRFKELVQNIEESPKFKGMMVLRNSSIVCYGDEGISDLKEYLKEGSIDADALNRENGVILMDTNKVSNGKSAGGALINATNIKVGDTIKCAFMSKGAPDTMIYKDVKVMGILNKGMMNETYNESGGVYLITTEKAFENLRGESNNSFMYIKLTGEAGREPVSKYLSDLRDKDPRYNYTDYSEIASRSRDGAITISIFLYGFVAVITLIGCLNIINTISTNLILRTRELSMLKAVGMTGGGIKKMVCTEGLLYGLISAVYGGILGTGFTFILFRIVIGVREFAWTMPWNHILIAVFGAAFVALVSSLIPLRRINNGNIIENIRMEE